FPVDSIERAHGLARPRPAHDDAMLGEAVVIECMERLAEFEHDVIRDVHDVVDGGLPQRFEALPQPVRRWLNSYAANDPRRVTPAKIRAFNLDTRRLRREFRRFLEFRLHAFQGEPVERRDFPRDSQMAEQVRTTNRDLSVQYRARCRCLFNGI